MSDGLLKISDFDPCMRLNYTKGQHAYVVNCMTSGNDDVQLSYGRIIDIVDYPWPNDPMAKYKHRITVQCIDRVGELNCSILDIHQPANNRRQTLKVQDVVSNIEVYVHECHPDVPAIFRQLPANYMNQLQDYLTRVWYGLSQQNRVKAVRRLYLTWHPDHNYGELKFCQQVCASIVEEVRKLETATEKVEHFKEFIKCDFILWDYQTKQPSSSNQKPPLQIDQLTPTSDRPSYLVKRDGSVNFEDSYSYALYAASLRKNWVTNDFENGENIITYPKPKEAKVWMRQADADYKNLVQLIHDAKISNDLKLFLCQQVVEKTLQAGLLATTGLLHKSHQLPKLALDLQNVMIISGLAGDVYNRVIELCENYHVDYSLTRYPGSVRQIPVEMYKAISPNQIQLAVEGINDIIQLLKNTFGFT